MGSSSIYTSQNTRPNKSLLPESSANNLSDTSSLLPPSLPEFQSSVLNGDSHCPLSSHLPLMGPSSELKQRSTTPARIEWLVEWAAFRKGLSLSTVHQQQSNILSQVKGNADHSMCMVAEYRVVLRREAQKHKGGGGADGHPVSWTHTHTAQSSRTHRVNLIPPGKPKH